MNEVEIPDLKTIKSYLTHASSYARSESEQEGIRMRLNSIDFLILLGKADLALNKGTVPEFEAARGYLAQAVPVASTDLQKDVLMKRLAAVEYALARNKISKGERQLAGLYREALNRHLQKAKEYGPEKSQEIDQEIANIKKWLEEFDKKHVVATIPPPVVGEEVAEKVKQAEEGKEGGGGRIGFIRGGDEDFIV